MAYSEKFLGIGSFIWFTGVVEDRMDPEKLGRLRVRCFGFHNDDIGVLPTKDLPWATVSLPTTSPAVSGLGQSPSFIVEGSWVWGYFRDGKKAQELIVVGTLPGKPNTTAGIGAFNDPNGLYPRNANEVDTNRLAVNDANLQHNTLATRSQALIQNVPTADFDLTTAADGSIIDASDQTLWSQPAIPYSAEYPYNHVYESESGHLLEFDDTTTKERIHLYHNTGTNIEMDYNGDRVDTITRDKYEVIARNNKVSVSGTSDMTISGHYKLYINRDGLSSNNYDIHVGPNANVNIQVDTGNINLVTKQGKINVNSGGDYNVKVGGNYELQVLGNKKETIAGTKTSETTGAVVHKGKTIDLNP